MARPSWTETKITPKNAHNITTKSNLSIFHIWQAAGMSMRPFTAVTMMAPNTTLGVYWNTGIRKRRVTITVTDIIMLETAVLAPALPITPPSPSPRSSIRKVNLTGPAVALSASISRSSFLQLPRPRADEEPVDPKKYLEESCKPKCVKPLLEYQACVKRIQGDETGHKHCTGQYFDYWSCVDKCVALKLFSKLK
ncbi:hypothetical protein POTOM_009734 [Populus tomentosa]|uniref:Complex III subunit VI n=1 Tax=Populus tomentosa TaxID=118781 RepID=A0A8X8A8U7_POPTO|nr:hypothetical protein POTOM_009734 [Populus tomentosa]